MLETSRRWYRQMPEEAGKIVMWMGREGRRKDHRCHAEDHEPLGEDVRRCCQ